MLETFKIFVDLIQTESFSRAATRNYLTQSAVSQRIRHLEGNLGQQLVVRGRGRMRPTEAGRLFYEACREILDRFARVRDDLNRIDNIVSGTLRIATVPSVGLHVLPPYVKKYLKEFPSVDMQLEYRRSNEVYEGILDLSFDLGIVAYAARHPQVAQLPFREDRLVLVVPPGHQMAAVTSIGLRKLQGQPFVAFETSIPTGKRIDKALRKAGVEVRLVHHFDNVETLKRAVEIGAGIAILPNSTVRRELLGGSLKTVSLAGSTWDRPLTLLYKKGRKPSGSAEKFIAVLQEEPEP